MDLLTNLVFWKFFSFIVVLVVVLSVATVDTDVVHETAWFASEEELETLEVTSGGRAAFSALAAAVTLLVNLIPVRSDAHLARQVNILVQFLGAGAAALAGWYWLSAETGDNPMPYILPMVILGVLVGAIMVFRVLWEFASELFHRKGSGRDGNTAAGE